MNSPTNKFSNKRLSLINHYDKYRELPGSHDKNKKNNAY